MFRYLCVCLLWIFIFFLNFTNIINHLSIFFCNIFINTNEYNLVFYCPYSHNRLHIAHVTILGLIVVMRDFYFISLIWFSSLAKHLVIFTFCWPYCGVRGASIMHLSRLFWPFFCLSFSDKNSKITTEFIIILWYTYKSITVLR